MKQFAVTFRARLARVDWIIIAAVMLIVALSLLTLGGSVDVFGTRRVIVQAFAACVGLLVALTISLIDYDELVRRLAVPIFIISVVAMVSVILFGTGDGQKNWIEFDFLPVQIQPSEFVKIMFIITFSKHIDTLKEKINHPLSVLQLAVHAGIIIGLVVISGDLGTALVYMAVMAAMLFTAGLSVWYFIAAAAVVTIAFPFLWDYFDEYQKERILVGFNPELDPLDKGYQPLLSRKAIAAGGFWGAGLTGGTVFKSIPIAESDFLFAVVSEKFGFLGAFAYMTLMGVVIIRILFIARRSRKDYAAYICVGVAAIFIAQSVENIGMCLALLPVVGIPLPFLSYGGSSMLSMFICLGFVESIHSHNEKYYFEREKS